MARARKLKHSAKVDWKNASDIKKKILRLKSSVGIDWIKTSRIYCFRSKNSSARAYARIWGLSRIWQMALKTPPAYIIEVLSEKFDRLSESEQEKVLLHEIAHIPKNFSGSLLPHIRKKGKRNFEDRVRDLIRKQKKINF